MKFITEEKFIDALRKALFKANFILRPDVLEYFINLKNQVTTEQQRKQVEIFIQNAEIAEKEKRGLCQDTGYVQLYIEMGNGVNLDFDLQQSIENVIASFYQEHYLRFSIADPLNRKNTGNNTPAFFSIEMTSGDQLKITVLLKGGGSENVTRADTLLPTSSNEDIIEWIVHSVKLAGSKACPPYLLGIGIGGTLEKAVSFSKKALLLPIDFISPNPEIQTLSDRIFKCVNKLKIGFHGLKFGETAMSVNILTHPCHIATLPIAISFGCNSVRQSSFTL